MRALQNFNKTLSIIVISAVITLTLSMLTYFIGPNVVTLTCTGFFAVLGFAQLSIFLEYQNAGVELVEAQLTQQAIEQEKAILNWEETSAQQIQTMFYLSAISAFSILASVIFSAAYSVTHFVESTPVGETALLSFANTLPIFAAICILAFIGVIIALTGKRIAKIKIKTLTAETQAAQYNNPDLF
tara:strand:+ start:11932 stop:12489 length:558 start_codon:yes stop_codon:yes gene_type:complete